MRKKLYILILIVLSLSSCMKDDELWVNSKPDIDVHYNGLFVVCEGNFMYGNASLSYYDIETMQVYNDVFFYTNALPLGDVAQSITIHGDFAYIVINNSGKIYVMNINTFEYVGKITGLTSPRYIHFISDTKAYVSDLYSKTIEIVNPQTFEITGSISINNFDNSFYQHSSEQMISFENYVFVNSWSYDNKILIIDSDTDELIDSIEVLKQPNSIVLDKFNKLWVLSEGSPEDSPYGFANAGLTKIDADSFSIEQEIKFEEGSAPSELVINGEGDILYFLNKDVYRFPVIAMQTPEKIISSPYLNIQNVGYYGLAVDPETSEIYVADVIDFVQNGNVYRFTSEGVPVDTFKVGISPGAFGFK